MNPEPALRLVAYTATYLGSNLAQDLDAIRAASDRNNPGADITGVLVYDRGRFIQAVEGPVDAIESLLGRVHADPRAGGMDVLIDTATPARSLQEWTMRTLRIDTEPALDADTLRAFRDAYLRNFRPDAAGFIDLLRALVSSDEAVDGAPPAATR